jgi:hypothetical protein
MGDPTKIFQYRRPLTGDVVYADPVAAKRQFVLALGCSLNSVLEDWNASAVPEGATSEMKQQANLPENVIRAAQAEERLVEAARGVFDLPPLNPATGEGVSDQECIEVIEAFLDFFRQRPTPGASAPT